MCGKKNDDPDRTPCRFFFWEENKCVDASHWRSTRCNASCLGHQLGVTEVRGTQQSGKWPTWARLSMHSDSVFCDG